MEKITLPSSLSRYQVRSDEVSNFVVFSADYIYWGNYGFDGSLNSIESSGNIDTDSMMDLALSSNKMVIFYDDHVEYYRMMGFGLTSSGPATT